MPFTFVRVERAAVGGGARTPFDDDKCCFKLQLANAYYYQLSVASTASTVSEVAVFALLLCRCFWQYR